VDVTTLRIEPGRAGAYAIVDAAGREAGKLRGDYVIGFTARYCGMVRWFADLDQAKTAVAAAHLERQGVTAR
jgi:hypothetical protein